MLGGGFEHVANPVRNVDLPADVHSPVGVWIGAGNINEGCAR